MAFLIFTNGSGTSAVTFELDLGVGEVPSAPVTSEPHVSAVPVAGSAPKARIGSGCGSKATVTGAVTPASLGLSGYGSAPSDISKLLVGRVWTLSGSGKPFNKGIITSVAQERATKSGCVSLSIALEEVQ